MKLNGEGGDGGGSFSLSVLIYSSPSLSCDQWRPTCAMSHVRTPSPPLHFSQSPNPQKNVVVSKISQADRVRRPRPDERPLTSFSIIGVDPPSTLAYLLR